MMQVAQHKTQSASRAVRNRFASQMATQAEKVGQRIAQERTARGWSRPELARQLEGVSTGNDVYRWETGKHMPRADTLEGIAALFDITVADLYAGAADPAADPSDLMESLSETERNAPDLKQVEDRIAALETTLLSRLGQAQSDLEDLLKSGELRKRS